MATYCLSIHCWIVFSLLSLFFRYTDTQCEITNHFGPNCEFTCHCIDGKQCNRTTGECPTDCDFSWAGPACQHRSGENEMVTRQSSNLADTIMKIAPLAVDSDLSTCSFTNVASKSEAYQWWRIWLNKVNKIRHVSILTLEQYLGSFENFQVVVENNTDKYENYNFPLGNICYHHNASVPSTSSLKIQCYEAYFGNQIRIVLANIHTQLVLCDVRLYGDCSDGTYGVNCTEKCSLNCKDICDKDNGTCVECKDGWTGIYCNKVCPKGFWGLSCANVCGQCVSSTCNHTDGVCNEGCAAGLKQTPHCDEECDNGSYGMNCSYSCSKNCKYVCDKTSGKCDSCKSGWHGSNCTIECEEGSWGENCKRRCLICNNQLCNKFNGSCNERCKPGLKQTEFCDRECDDGWYGMNCSEKCSTSCKEDTFCRKTDGSCFECKSGLQGLQCEIEQTSDSLIHLSGASMAGIVVAFCILIALSVFVAVIMTRKLMFRKQTSSEGAGISFSNVVAAEKNSTEVKASVYETINRGKDTEHTYG